MTKKWPWMIKTYKFSILEFQGPYGHPWNSSPSGGHARFTRNCWQNDPPTHKHASFLKQMGGVSSLVFSIQLYGMRLFLRIKELQIYLLSQLAISNKKCSTKIQNMDLNCLNYHFLYAYYVSWLSNGQVIEIPLFFEIKKTASWLNNLNP